jgi:ribonucleoside-diphosphate reductase subunit M1
VVRVVVRNMNKIIDCNHYPVQEARTSNLRHRPIGIGVQGLADVFMLLKLPYESDEARELNKNIFETLYYAAADESAELARAHGPYASFAGSPASQGLLQFDLWGHDPGEERHPWEHLKSKIKVHGLRNSLLVAPMPTASTSQILGYTESFEPLTSNVYLRRTLAGEFICANPYLIEDLDKLGLWDKNMRDKIVAQNGSVQNIPEIPEKLRRVYKTVWEMRGKRILDMAADRGVFIDQSQSLNAHIPNPTTAQLTSYHFYAHEKGLKTGMYYLRSRPAADAIKVTIDPLLLAAKEKSAVTTSSGEEPRRPVAESPGVAACSYNQHSIADFVHKADQEENQAQTKKRQLMQRSPFKKKQKKETPATACSLRPDDGSGECFSCGS